MKYNFGQKMERRIKLDYTTTKYGNPISYCSNKTHVAQTFTWLLSAHNIPNTQDLSLTKFKSLASSVAARFTHSQNIWKYNFGQKMERRMKLDYTTTKYENPISYRSNKTHSTNLYMTSQWASVLITFLPSNNNK